MLYVNSIWLCTGCSTKEAIGSFFRRCINFQFHVATLSQERCFYSLSTTQDNKEDALRKEPTTDPFVEHLKVTTLRKFY